MAALAVAPGAAVRRGARVVVFGVALLGIVALVAWPWLRADTQWLETGDGPNHLLRIYVIDAALHRGEWYPRWLSDLYLGYGYPLLNYYAPAIYYVAAAFGAAGATVYSSLVWTGTVGLVLGAAGMFALVAALHPGRYGAALVATVAYVLAPYPFFANLYERAAIPEALALGLLPWLLLAGLRTWRGSRRWAVMLTLLAAALPLTHNISALLALGLLTLWLAALPWIEGIHLSAIGWRRVGVAVAAGLALSAFFWLPALAETRYVQIARARPSPDGFRDWLFTGPDLLRGLGRAWEPAVAGPHADLGLVLSEGAVGKSAPERVSPAQAGLLVLSVGLPVLAGVRSRSLAFWGGIAALCWGMNAAPALWLWLHVPLLSFIQFPWRLYGPLSLAVALCAAEAVVRLGQLQIAGAGGFAGGSVSIWSQGRALAARVALFGTAALLALSSVVSKPYTPGPLPAGDVSGQELIADETNHYAGGSTTGGEFLPKTVQFAVYTQGHDRGIMLYEDARDEAGWDGGLVRVLDGRATVTDLAAQAGWIRARVDGETASTLAFHQLLFPGWRGYVDGQPVAVEPAPYVEALQAWLGFMVVRVPPGTHQVEVRLGPTPVRLAADALSAATAAALLAWWLLPLLPRVPWTARLAAGLAAIAAGVTVGLELHAAAPARAAPAHAERLALDVTRAIVSGQAQTATPSGSGSSILPPFLDVRYQDVAGEVRRWLYMHPPSRASARLHVPPHAYFQAGLALDPQTWQTDVGDGVRFVLEADGPRGHALLMDRRINPRANVAERRWVDVWVSLEALTGQDVTLTLRTDPVEDLNYDWAGWSNPRVVIWESARPDPGSPHPY